LGNGPHLWKMPAKKDVLFINPWIYDFTAYDFWLKPLGLLYMASLLQKYTNLRLSFIDCLDRYHPLLDKNLKKKADGRGAFHKEEVSKPSILMAVPRKYSRYGIPVSLFGQELERLPRPELVLLGCTMTYWYPGVQRVVEIIRKKFGRVPVVLGGVYPTLIPEHARRFSGADFVVEGHGEKKILPLLREILGDGACPPHRLENLDDMPRPAFSLLRNTDFLPLLTSRGCPFHCSFCAGPLLSKRFEQRNPHSVIEEIKIHHLQNKARNFAFYDDSLLLNKRKHIIPFLEGLIEKGLPIAFHTPNGLHIKEIDFELASLLKKANFQSLFLSQETFDETILEGSSPKVSSKDLEKALFHLERAGYGRQEISVYLMVGLPEQDSSSIKESIFRVKNLGARPRLAYFSPVPGTQEWQRMVEKGFIREDSDPLLHNKLTFPYLWEDISPQDFENIKNLLNKKTY
jgi:hypothetical protein